jgi:aminoglycoside phosphotransferase (APT) family kinase protein
MNNTIKDNHSIASQLEAILMHQDGSKIVNFHLLASGWESDIYVVKKRKNGQTSELVMRLYSPGMSAANATKEWQVLRFLVDQGFPVPRVYDPAPEIRIENRLFLLMERIVGYPLWSKLHSKKNYEAGLGDVAELMVRLHRVNLAPLASEWDLPNNSKTALRGMYAEWRGLVGGNEKISAPGLERVLEWLENGVETLQDIPMALNHQDFHPENVMVETATRRKVVIDWTGAHVGDPRMDVFWAALLVGHQAKEEYFDLMVAAYEAAAGERLADRPYFEALVCFRRIASLMLSALMGAESLGMQGDVSTHIARQVPILRTIYRRFITATDGMRIPEVESFLAQFTA